MSANVLTISQGLQARLQQILTADGYSTDAGQRVYIARRRFSEADTYPLITIVPPETRPTRNDIAAAHYLAEVEFDLIGVIATFEDSAPPADDLGSNPIALQQDIQNAVLPPQDDALAALANDIEWVSSELLAPPDNENETQVRVTVRVSWYEAYT